MPETSIVVKATDRYSDALKAMSKMTKSFSKDVDSLEEGLYALNKNKYTLQLDAKKAQQSLKEAEKQFDLTGSAADGLKVELARANYDNTVRNLNAVSKAAKDTEKEISKLENRSEGGGGGSGGFGGIVKTVASAGLVNMVGTALQGATNTLIGSMAGDTRGSVFSSALSSAISGAAIGSIVPGVGTALGAIGGAIVGAASGVMQNYESQDEAFKSYYKGLYDEVNEGTANSLTSGSTLAAGRETDLISFSTLFGGKAAAESYLADLVQMANVTPFLYDDLTSMSKTLATYGYDTESILPVLQTVGDAGAALGMTTSDMNAVATALGRMKSSNKTSLEYLNILNDRGIGAVGMLADAYGVDQGDIYKMVSSGAIAGQDAVEIILGALGERFAGAMEAQSKTFSGITSTREGLMEELDNAAGEGYNETRMSSLTADVDAYGGALGEAMQEVNRVIGENKAMLENLADQYKREGLSALLLGEETSVYDAADAQTLKTMREEYLSAQEAYRNGDSEAGLKMESLMEQAEALATSAYEASGQYQLAQEAERDQLGAIRDNTKAVAALTDYYLSQEGTKGMAAAGTTTNGAFTESSINSGYTKHRSVHQRAMGIDYVPYDNFPALLHEGERVLTAAQNRAAGEGSCRITISGNTFHIREEADVGRVAQELLSQLETANMRG